MDDSKSTPLLPRNSGQPEVEVGPVHIGMGLNKRQSSIVTYDRDDRRVSKFLRENADEDTFDEDNKDREHQAHTQHAHSHVHELTEAEKALMYSYEALDYDIPMNDLYRSQRLKSDQNKREVIVENALRWSVFGVTGVLTGTLAFVLSFYVEKLSEWKFDKITDSVKDNRLASAFFSFWGISAFFVLISTFLVAVVEPVAGGSGIPEIKAYLNGTNYLRFLRFKTLVSKAVGVVFSVSGGLIIGKEGPLVHSGAIIAANVSNVSWLNELTCWGPTTKKWINRFRNDKDKRDFVAGGAAAGVAAAFGAPVGGILFSLEEASSFWSTRLTWMAFLCSMLGTFMLNVWKIVRSGAGDFSGLISFGPPLNGTPYHLWETPFFICIALFGGLMGAAFNHINERISHWRRDHLVGKPLHRMAEAVGIASITAILSFWAPYFLDECKLIPGAENKEFYKSFRCADGEFNTMATVVFATTEKSIRGFFHNQAEYDWQALIAYFFIVFFLAVITYGIAVPSGLFVPCILMGCSFGRLTGEMMRHLFESDEINPGTYAIIGATAMLGGVARMTISLTVILLETTQDVEFVMPIMLTLIVSKWVGDLFNISLYDLHVELKCFPFVESAPSANMNHLVAGDIMQDPVVTMKESMTVREVTTILDQCTHNGFPVIDSDNCYVGMILRNQLNVLMNKRAFGPPEVAKSCVELEDFSTSLQSKKVTRKPLSDSDKDEILSIAPFMNPVPITVQAGCALSRVYTLFRSLGIRHLVVVSKVNQVVGIISRKEITSTFDQDLF